MNDDGNDYDLVADFGRGFETKFRRWSSWKTFFSSALCLPMSCNFLFFLFLIPILEQKSMTWKRYGHCPLDSVLIEPPLGQPFLR